MEEKKSKFLPQLIPTSFVLYVNIEYNFRKRQA